MVDRGADDRQPERDVDRLAERQQLDRNQSLVVVAGDHRIEFAAHRADEHCVGRKRPGDIDAALPRRRRRRAEHRLLLAADQPVLAGVRVQSGQPEPRRRTAESRQRRRRQVDDAVERGAGQRRRDLGERNVDGREDHPQRLGVEHHRDPRRPGQMGEQIGVAAPGKAGGGERLLVDRRRRHRVDPAGLRVLDGADDGVVGGAARRSGNFTAGKARHLLGRSGP